MDSQSASRKAKIIFSKGISFDKNAVQSNRKAKRVILNARPSKTKETRKMKDRLNKTIPGDSHVRQNKFHDSRNLNATEAEIHLALYQQRQRKAQGKFTLGDEGSNYSQSLTEDVLTHGGRSISQLSAAELSRFELDGDDDSDHYADDEAAWANFGGGVLTGEGSKIIGMSREEFLQLSLPDRRRLMIHNSKIAKRERQGQKADAERELQEIDMDFDDIRDLLDFQKVVDVTEDHAMEVDDENEHIDALSQALLQRIRQEAAAEEDEDDHGATSTSDISLDGKNRFEHNDTLPSGISIGSNVAADDYVKQTLMLQYHAKAIAGDREVTEAERAQHYRDRMLALEDKRIRRQQGEDVSDDDDLSSQPANRSRRKKKNDDDDDDDLFLRAMLTDDEDETGADDAHGPSVADSDDDDDDDGSADDDDDEEDIDSDDISIDEANQIAPAIHTSGDSLDDGIALDSRYVDHTNYDEDSIEDVSFSKADRHQKAIGSRKERKMDLGIAIQDVDHMIPPDAVYDELRSLLKSELPYAFEDLPDTYTAFATNIWNLTSHIFTTIKRKKIQLHQLEPHNVMEIILYLYLSRLIQFYHPRINAANTQRMEALYRFMWKMFKVHCVHYTSPSTPPKSPSLLSLVDKPTMRDLLAICDVITKNIFVLTELMPRYTGKACASLVELFAFDSTRANQIDVETKYGTHGALQYPPLDELFSYKLLMQMYPLSDYRHTIMTPLQLHLARVLALGYIVNPADIIKSLFLCSCLLEFWKSSQRCVPEVLAYIESLLGLLVNNVCTSFTHSSSLRQATFQSIDLTLVQPLLQSHATFNLVTRLDAPTVSPQNAAQRKNSRACGVLSLELMTTTPDHDYVSTPAFRDDVMFALVEIITTVLQVAKDLLSLNEVVQPYRHLLSRLVTLIKAQSIAEHLVSKSKSVTKTKGGSIVVTSDMLQDSHFHKLYPPIVFRMEALIAGIDTVIRMSLLTRAPLSTFAKAIAQRTYEPKLDEAYIDSKKNSIESQVEERKRLEKKLLKHKKALRREVKEQSLQAALQKQAQQRKFQEKQAETKKRHRRIFEQSASDSNALGPGKKITRRR